MPEPRSFKRKTARVLVVVLTILGGVALLCTLLWPRERLLLSQARKLPLSVNTFWSGRDQYGMGAWRSSHEQLLLHNTPGENHDTVWVRDIWTGQEASLQPFNDRFATQLKLTPRFVAPHGIKGAGKPMKYTLPMQQFSPDGKWLLWQDGTNWRAFALDGSAQRQWPRDPQENRYRHVIQWNFNGRMWLEPRYGAHYHINGALLHSLEPSVAEGERTFAQPAGAWILGTTPEHHLLTHDLVYGKAANPYALYDTDLESDHAPTRKINVRLPAGTSGADVRLSPDGTRLLWSLYIRQEAPGPPLMQTLFQWLGMKARVQNGLWVSNADGSGLREVGHLVSSPVAATPTTARNAVTVIILQQQAMQQVKRFYGMQWLADSKHALFMHDNAVYEISGE